MKPDSWYGSRQALLISSVLVPPVGLVLLWVRSGTGAFRKLFGTAPILLLGIFYFHLIFGIHVEFDGSASRRRLIVSLHSPERHYAAIERDRAEQKAKAMELAASSVKKEPSRKMAGPVASASVEASDAPVPAVSPQPEAAAYWTSFRGPNRDGIYSEMEILTEWPDNGPPLIWRQKVGGGYASMVVADGKVFTIEQRREQEVVAAYELDTGREVWADSWKALFQERMGGDGPRATPTWEGGRLYALGAMGELRCLEAETGRLLWRVNILEDNKAENLEWGMSASPLIVDDKVIVLPGGHSGNSVVAYNKLTGEPVWKSLSDKAAYTSPMLVTLAGQRQILVVSARRVMGLGVEEGNLLWDYLWRTANDLNAAQPILLGENRFFISAGYGHGAAAVEVSKTDKHYSARKVWQNIRIKNKFSSSVLYQGHIYGLDEAILVCINAETGERKWKAGRYGYGQVLLADGHLIVLGERGKLALVKATPEGHEELASFRALKGKTWNHPSIAEGRLLVRNTTEMACFKIQSR